MDFFNASPAMSAFLKETGNITPITVADVAARKNAGSYTNPLVGQLRVIQTDLPGILWTLVALPVTADASWIGQPYTVNPSGEILLDLRLSNFRNIIPESNELGGQSGRPSYGDGSRVGGNVLMSTRDILLTTAINDTGLHLSMPDELVGSMYILTNVTHLQLSGLVTSIPDQFAGYSAGLQKLHVPASVETIGNQAFEYCGLTELFFEEGLLAIGAQSFEANPLTELVLPSTVTGIGEDVSSYGATGRAFNNCPNLASIKCYATTAPTLYGINNFGSLPATEIHVPVGSTGYGATWGGLTVVYSL